MQRIKRIILLMSRLVKVLQYECNLYTFYISPENKLTNWRFTTVINGVVRPWDTKEVVMNKKVDSAH